MAHLSVRHHVRDYAAWKRVFDEFAPQRRSGGEIDYQIYHVDDDHNNIIVLLEWDSIANAKAFIASDALREAMANSGVEGEPVVFFLNAGDSGKF